MTEKSIRVRSWVEAGEEDLRQGLLGWVGIEIGSLAIGNITLRVTTSGRHALAFPSRTSKSGQRHSIVAPLGDAARRKVERMIFEQLNDTYGLGIGSAGAT